MATEEKFVVSQVAKILQMPESLIKDWTNGRRLEIGPQRTAIGKGFPNLYGTVDMYKLAVARQMSIDGFTPRAIQKIVDKLGVKFASGAFAVIRNDDHRYPPRSGRSLIHVEVLHDSESDPNLWLAVREQIRTSVGGYVLYIAGITEDVNRRVDMFLQKAFGEGQRENPSQRELHPQTDDLNREKITPSRKFRPPQKEKGE